MLSPGKLTRYDRDTGNPVKEIPVPAGYGGLIPRGDELLDVDLETGRPVVTRINLDTCESRTETISPRSPVAPPAAALQPRRQAPPLPKAGLPVGTPGKDAGKVMDPKKVAEQAQHLSYPAKIALPAILAHNMNQERTLAAYDDDPVKPAPDDDFETATRTMLIPTKDGFMQFTVKLLEPRITTRAAMKPAPAKSVLNGNLTVSQTGELANEMLNEAQRARGGDVVREDESRYLVTLRQADLPDAWTGEVIGPPALFPLTTVNVLTANKSVLVLDKTNKVRWQASLTYNVRGYGSLEPDERPLRPGPLRGTQGHPLRLRRGRPDRLRPGHRQRALAPALDRHHGAVLRRPGHDLRQHHHRQP